MPQRHTHTRDDGQIILNMQISLASRSPKNPRFGTAVTIYESFAQVSVAYMSRTVAVDDLSDAPPRRHRRHTRRRCNMCGFFCSISQDLHRSTASNRKVARRSAMGALRLRGSPVGLTQVCTARLTINNLQPSGPRCGVMPLPGRLTSGPRGRVLLVTHFSVRCHHLPPGFAIFGHCSALLGWLSG